MALQLLITLREVSPSVWRKIIVPDNYSFYQLHDVLQQCFGWKDSHLFQFSENDIMDEIFIGIPDEEADQMDAIDARTKSISGIFRAPGDCYTYIYDFGDTWEHDIVLEQILPDKIEGPYCTGGAGACPPEDVGGVRGYQQMNDIFESEDQEEIQSYREWLGIAPNEKWNPDYCNISEINNRLLLL
jgi:hypothetical protein